MDSEVRMKSVFVTIVMFLGIAIILESGIMSFFAQKTFFYFACFSVVISLISAVAFLGTPFSKPLFKRRGEKHDKNSDAS